MILWLGAWSRAAPVLRDPSRYEDYEYDCLMFNEPLLCFRFKENARDELNR